MKALAIVIAALVVHAVTSAAGPQVSYRTRTDIVVIDVAVMDGRSPVTGLTAADFELRDNGVLQRVQDFSADTVPLDVMLTVDISGSMNASDRAVVERAVGQVTSRLRPEDRASVTVFGSHLAERSPLRHPPISRLDMTEIGTGTAVLDAMLLTLVTPQPAGRRALTLFMTDGQDTASYFDERIVLDTARHARIPTSVILAPDRASGSVGGVLRSIALQTGGELVELGSRDRLTEAFLQTVENFRAGYVLRYAPAGVSTSGWHDVAVSVKNSQYRVRARRGYWANR